MDDSMDVAPACPIGVSATEHPSHEPAMLQEGEHYRASPTMGMHGGMPCMEDLARPPSPPPSGTTFDCDLERASTRPVFLYQTSDDPMPGSHDSRLSQDRTRRQVIQLNQWKTLLHRQPHDVLAFFWREQVDVLEGLLHRQQYVGMKRSAEEFDEPRKFSRKSNTALH